MSHEMAAAKILAGNRYLTLATVGDIGPWATPLAYTVDPDMTLVFYSAADSLHCTNIARHPKVSGAIFDSREPSDTATGIQFIGSAREVVPQQLEDTMERYFVPLVSG